MPALLGTILAGLCMPFLAVILVDAMLVFFYDDYDKMMVEVKSACFHFVGGGIVQFRNTTVSAWAIHALRPVVPAPKCEILSNLGRPVHVCL